jgi:hypothetical protein
MRLTTSSSSALTSLLLCDFIAATSTSLEQAKQFEILAYEISAPIIFAKGKFNAYISPAYVMPKNLVIVSGRPDLTERGSNMFYFTAGVGVIL